MADVIRSLFVLTWGVLRRFLLWLPFILLDSTDYWERYIQPVVHLPMPVNALPSLAAFGVCASAFYTFHELRVAKKSLETQFVQAVHIDPVPLRQELGVGEGDDPLPKGCLYYIVVKNSSICPISDVGVYLTKITPSVPEINWLPVPLHIKHDNVRPYKDTFTLNPKGVKYVDLVSLTSAAPSLQIKHAVSSVQVRIPAGTYTLTVRVEGREVRHPPRLASLSRSTEMIDSRVCLSPLKRSQRASLNSTPKCLES